MVGKNKKGNYTEMPHGLPDWGLVGPKDITYGLDGMGELAARLGSPTVWDRRGDVIFFDNYEDGMGKVTVGQFGTGAHVALTCEDAWHGAFALKTVAASVPLDPAGRHTIHLSYPMPRPNVSNLGFEIWFGMHQYTERVGVYMAWYTTTATIEAGVRYWNDGPPYMFQYESAPDIWTDIVVVPKLREYGKPIHMMKLVCNLVDKVYIRAILDDVCYPLPGLTVPTKPFLFAPSLVPLFEHTSIRDNTSIVVVDNLVITQNEPT